MHPANRTAKIIAVVFVPDAPVGLMGLNDRAADGIANGFSWLVNGIHWQSHDNFSTVSRFA
jgi:hypothetical protein